MSLHLRQPATLYIPSPLHSDAYTRAKELGFTVLVPEDLKEDPKSWTSISDAIVLRQGKLNADLAEAKKLRIIARNGTGYDMIVRASHQKTLAF